MNASKSYFWTTFTLVVLLVVGLMGARIATMNAHYNEEKVMWETKTKLINNYKDDYPKTLILGTSVTLAINPDFIEEQTGQKVMNLSLGGGRMAYHYFALKRILDQGVEIDKIYISTTRRNENTVSYSLDGAFGERMVRWFLNPQEAEEMEAHVPGTVQLYKDSRFMGPQYFHSKAEPWYKFEPKTYLEDQPSSSLMAQTLGVNRGYFLFGHPLVPVADGERGDYYSFDGITGQHYLYGPNPGTGWGLLGGPTDIGRIYTEKLIALMEAHEIDYEFFFLPLPEARATNNAPKFAMDDLGAVLEPFDKAKINTKVVVLPNDTFWDTFHVNANGSKIYNQYFVDYIMNDQDPVERYHVVDFPW